jgi:hypothetical protein
VQFHRPVFQVQSNASEGDQGISDRDIETLGVCLIGGNGLQALENLHDGLLKKSYSVFGSVFAP